MSEVDRVVPPDNISEGHTTLGRPLRGLPESLRPMVADEVRQITAGQAVERRRVAEQLERLRASERRAEQASVAAKRRLP
jgi:hypothetical protein